MSGSTLTLWSYENTFVLFDARSQEYHNTCVMVHASKTDKEVKKSLNKDVFVFFAPKKFGSFIKLRLNHRCHMDYFNLTMFLLPTT